MITIFSFVAMAEHPHQNEKLKTYKEIILSSLSSADNTQNGSWSYKINKTLTVNGETNITIENFFPNKNTYQQWSLEKINDDTPNKKQLKEYLADKQEEIDEGILSSADKSLLKLIDINSLKVEKSNNEIIQLSFNGFYPKFGDDAKGKIDGLLTLDLKKHYVSLMKLESNDEFTAKVILNIEQWQISLLFNKHEQTIVLKERQLNMKGTVAIFKDIEVSADVTFDDYQLIESAPE